MRLHSSWSLRDTLLFITATLNVAGCKIQLEADPFTLNNYHM